MIHGSSVWSLSIKVFLWRVRQVTWYLITSVHSVSPMLLYYCVWSTSTKCTETVFFIHLFFSVLESLFIYNGIHVCSYQLKSWYFAFFIIYTWPQFNLLMVSIKLDWIRCINTILIMIVFRRFDISSSFLILLTHEINTHYIGKIKKKM